MKAGMQAQEGDYLWAAHGRVERALENLRVICQALTEIETEAETAAQEFPYPPDCNPEDLKAHVAEAREAAEKALESWDRKASLFRDQLLRQGIPQDG